MFDTLNSVPWERLHHAYGLATDAPKHIRDLDSDDEDERQEAINQFLWSSAFHQYTLYTATPFVIPFVIEALASPTLAERSDGVGRPMKRELMHFLRMCAKGGQRDIHGDPDPQDLTIEDAMLSGKYLYERYANDPDNHVRSEANWLRLFCDGHSNDA